MATQSSITNAVTNMNDIEVQHLLALDVGSAANVFNLGVQTAVAWAQLRQGEANGGA